MFVGQLAGRGCVGFLTYLLDDGDSTLLALYILELFGQLVYGLEHEGEQIKGGIQQILLCKSLDMISINVRVSRGRFFPIDIFAVYQGLFMEN